MDLDPQTKEWITLTAERLAYQVNKEILAEHIKTCPYGLKLKMSKMFIAGVLLGITVCSGAGGALGVVIAKLF